MDFILLFNRLQLRFMLPSSGIAFRQRYTIQKKKKKRSGSGSVHMHELDMFPMLKPPSLLRVYVSQNQVFTLVLLDLPGILFFSTYTLLVLFWAEIYRQVSVRLHYVFFALIPSSLCSLTFCLHATLIEATKNYLKFGRQEVFQLISSGSSIQLLTVEYILSRCALVIHLLKSLECVQ